MGRIRARQAVVLAMSVGWLLLGCEETSFTDKAISGPTQSDKDLDPNSTVDEGKRAKAPGTQGDLPDDREGSVPGEAKGDAQTDSNDRLDTEGYPTPEVSLPPRLVRERVFSATETGQGTVSSLLDEPYLEQQLIMRRTYSDKSFSTRQVVRPKHIHSFMQGAPGAPVTEVYDQVVNRLLDILVVVDNSKSMQEEQKNLSTKLLPLMSEIGDSDWKIGVVSTDPDKTCLIDTIVKGDPNAEGRFKTAVSTGTKGSSNERGVLTAVNSLQGTCLPQPWIRPMSTLAVLFVSDEDNCSDGKGCPNKDYATGAYLYDYLASVRRPGSTAKVYGLIWHPSQDQSQCSTALNKANIYSSLIADTGGTWGSICSTDYGPTLKAISRSIKVTLNSKFTLTSAPDPGTLKVYVGPTEVNSGFAVMGNVIDFAQAPAEGAKITFSYKRGSSPIFQKVQLAQKPLSDSVNVSVNNEVLPRDLYTINPATMSVEFAEAPPALSKVSVGYTQDVALRREFALGDPIKGQTLRVSINDVETNEFVADEARGIVSFNQLPREGALIDFKYTQVGPGITRYPFALPGGAPGLVALDTQSQAPISVTFDNGSVVFDAADVVENRVVSLRFDNTARQAFTVELPQAPIPSSVKALGGNVLCSKAVKVVDKTVLVDGCGFSADVDEVKLFYEYVIASVDSFAFDEKNLPGPGDFQEWRVFVNDIETSDFTRTGNLIRLSKVPAYGKVLVKVRLTQVAP